MTSTADIAWEMRRDGELAQCILRTLRDRVELHMWMTHDVVMSQSYSGPEQASAISAAWRRALTHRGWIEAESPVTVRLKPDRRRRQARQNSRPLGSDEFLGLKE
jgi:hypothetical protein